MAVTDKVTFAERLALHAHYRGEAKARRIVEKGGHDEMVMLVLTAERWLG